MSQNLKSIKPINGKLPNCIRVNEFTMEGIRLLAKHCPNLEYSPSAYPDIYLEYINSIQNQSKVKKWYFRSSNRYDTIANVIRSSPCLEELSVKIRHLYIKRGLINLLKTCCNLKKLVLDFHFAPNNETVQELIEMINSLKSLEKLTLYLLTVDSTLIKFCLKQNFKTELGFSRSAHIGIEDLDDQAKNLLFCVNLNYTSLSDLNHFSNLKVLRFLRFHLNQYETIPEVLWDANLMPRMKFTILGIYFSSFTKNSFENFIEGNGRRLIGLKVHIVEEASQFINIVSKTTNLFSFAIEFDVESEETLTEDDAMALYRIPVENYIEIYPNSTSRRERFERLFAEAWKKSTPKVGLIFPFDKHRVKQEEVPDENLDEE